MPPTWKALSASVRGNWHEHTGQKNQDSVRLADPVVGHDSLFIAVSDGHGSARSFRSDRGSALAAECTLKALRKFTQRFGDSPLSVVRNQARQKWLRELLADWKKAVRRDVEVEPFSFMDFAAFPEPPPVIKPGSDMPGNAYLAYGATLIVVAVTRRFILYAQLGDGDIITVMANGEVSRPLNRHHEFYANETASLCTEQAIQEFQVRVEPVRAGGPALIMLSTDGYANCFGEDDGFFKVGADFLQYMRAHGHDFVGDQLETWLRESSRAGSGDDITVGLAVRLGALAGHSRAEAADEVAAS